MFERWFCCAGFGHHTKLIPSAFSSSDSEAKDLGLRFAIALKGLKKRTFERYQLVKAEQFHSIIDHHIRR